MDFGEECSPKGFNMIFLDQKGPTQTKKDEKGENGTKIDKTSLSGPKHLHFCQPMLWIRGPLSLQTKRVTNMGTVRPAPVTDQIRKVIFENNLKRSKIVYQLF